MLKWVVTRGPQEMCHSWKSPDDRTLAWNKENDPSHQPLFVQCDDNSYAAETLPNTLSASFYPEKHRPFSSDTATVPNASPTAISDMSVNNSVSSFRYFLVNHHSSPLKRLNHRIGSNLSSILATTSPLHTNRYCASPRHTSSCNRTQRRRHRLSSLHIREPSEMASPSYRPGDDPANDLSSDLILPSALDGKAPTSHQSPSPWRDVWEMFATENVHYNEREIKTPERHPAATIPNTRQLVRRRAVRRRKTIQTSTKHE